jgi:2-polyprenyl-3-methyl-5-hydroxy-6-metoxy-1,4-benzoquinol methylase
MKKWLQIGSKKVEYYKGILIKADLGLHSELEEIIRNKVPAGSKILDLGAGEGALSQRLADIGYKVVSVDMNKNDFKADTAKFYQIDFNQSSQVEKFISEFNGYFDSVLGVEVIEHIENPWEYIRTLKSLLKPGGLLVLSTPNITSWLSRLFFLFKGQFISFDKKSLEYGHINPINAWEMEVILKGQNFEDIYMKDGGTLPDIWITRNEFYWILYILSLFFRPFMKGISKGWCLLVTATKSK